MRRQPRPAIALPFGQRLMQPRLSSGALSPPRLGANALSLNLPRDNSISTSAWPSVSLRAPCYNCTAPPQARAIAALAHPVSQLAPNVVLGEALLQVRQVVRHGKLGNRWCPQWARRWGAEHARWESGRLECFAVFDNPDGTCFESCIAASLSLNIGTIEALIARMASSSWLHYDRVGMRPII